MRSIILSAVFFASVANAQAQTACRDIADSTARLSCYDRSAPPKPPAAKERSSLNATLGNVSREDYAKKLKLIFLDAGMNLEAYVKTSHQPQSSWRYNLPALVVFGDLTQVHVYKIQQKLDLIGNAKRLQFKTIDFDGRMEGKWLFDLTKAGPACSRGLCF